MLKDIFTDAAGRIEIKTILGVASFAAALAIVIATRDLAVFAALMGTALALLGLTTAGDAAIDKAKDK